MQLKYTISFFLFLNDRLLLHYIKSLLRMGVAMFSGGPCRQKCLFGRTWLIQSRLIEPGAQGHAVLVLLHKLAEYQLQLGEQK